MQRLEKIMAQKHSDWQCYRHYLCLISVLVLTLSCQQPTSADTTLSIATWGGAYEQAQQLAQFQPFTRHTGITIETRAYAGGLGILRQSPLPDIVDMTEADAHQACELGLLQRIDYQQLLASPTGTDPPVDVQDDFLENSFSACGIAHLSYANVIAYNSRAFPGEKPRTVRDFFDTKRFPGKRALRKEPDALLEWALMADKVPLSQIYDLLSTERGIRLALRRLDTLKPHIIWWHDPEEPPELLASGKVNLASGFNGRFFNAQAEGAPLLIIWHGQIIDRDVWAVPATTPLSAKIRRFIRFATASQQMARLAENIAYGPTRRSALKQIGRHPRKPIAMLNHLPTAPHHLKHALIRDSLWYARTAEIRQRAFAAWLAE